MKEKERISEIKIIVCGNEVDVLSDSISYRGLKIATLGLMAFIKKNAELVKSEIEEAVNEELREEEFKSGFANMLHDWVDEVCREEYELR